MPRPLPELAADPLARFLAIARALEEGRRWSEGATPLQFTAVSLISTPGDAESVASNLIERAEAVRAQASWTSPLRSSIRYLIAAILLRDEITAEAFSGACEDVSAGMKERKLGARTSAHAYLAALILLNHDGEILPSRLDRMAAIYAGMKEHHPWLTNSGDYAPCALLATTDVEVEPMMERIEALYDGLRDHGFGKGDALQRASHILFFNPADDQTAASRFDALFRQFKDAGLWMHAGDYDEVATLGFLDATPEQVTEAVLRHREAIKELKPRTGKEVSFSLACGTAFLELIRHGEPDVIDATRLMQLQAMLDAQTAAVAASTAAIAAAAAASG